MKHCIICRERSLALGYVELGPNTNFLRILSTRMFYVLVPCCYHMHGSTTCSCLKSKRLLH